MHDIVDIAVLQSVGASAGINVTIGDAVNLASRLEGQSENFGRRSW